MKLIQAIEVLQKRPVTAEQAAQLSDFQRLYSIDDDDPLIVVLALMAQSQMITQTLPELLQQKAKEMTELHANVLRDQSVLIAKDLIRTISMQIKAETEKEADRDWKIRYTRYAAIFLGGVVTMGIVARIFRYVF